MHLILDSSEKEGGLGALIALRLSPEKLMSVRNSCSGFLDWNELHGGLTTQTLKGSGYCSTCLLFYFFFF